MRALGLLLSVAGALVLAAAVIVGLPFSVIYLLGFVGTGGREAGRELLMFLPATLFACASGAVLIKLGRRLRAAR